MYDNKLILSMGLLNFVSNFAAGYVSMPLPKRIMSYAKPQNYPSTGGLSSVHFPTTAKQLIFRYFIYLAKSGK